MKLPYRFKIVIISILLVVFFIVLNLTNSAESGIKNFFYLISSPIQRVFLETGDNVSDFFGWILEVKIIKEENEKLSLQNQELLAENLLLKELKKENETLREALKIGLEKDFQLLLAKVIAKDISQDSILINKGLKDNISKGLPVITSQKVIIGRIGEVYDNFSEVILISNKESSFDAKISEKDSYPPEEGASLSAGTPRLPTALPAEGGAPIYGVVKGKGNLELYLDLIPKDKEISEGDFVITSALGGIFPQGLLVGEIKKVKKTDIEPWQTAEIYPSFQLKELDNLFIISEF